MWCIMLTISKLNINLHFKTPTKLPYWLGSAFRGLFGRQIRRIVCNTLDVQCSNCNSNEDCLYYYVYEKPVSNRGYAPPMRPIVIIPPFFGKELYFKENGYLTLDLLFFGDFRRYLPHVLLALRLAGQEGVGSERYYGLNRFEIQSADCAFSQKPVFDGTTIYFSNIKSINLKDIPPLELNSSRMNVCFRTPLSCRRFPPTIEELITGIRNRTIRLVNEYGSQNKLMDFKVDGSIKTFVVHNHNLYRKSSRSAKNMFRTYTGKVDYEIKELDKDGRWFLNCGTILGCGGDMSFGLGFFIVT